MKLILILFFLGFHFIANCQAKIKSITDNRIPKDAVAELNLITGLDKLENFSYEKTTTELDKNDHTISVITTIKLYFSDGKIKGSLKVSRMQVGYESDDKKTDVEICYMYCCTLKTNSNEKCTEDYKKFKRWQNASDCASTRTIACN